MEMEDLSKSKYYHVNVYWEMSLAASKRFPPYLSKLLNGYCQIVVIQQYLRVVPTSHMPTTGDSFMDR